MDTRKRVLIIDLSYYNFYRYYATIQWYKSAHSDDTFEVGYDWVENIVFMEKYTKMFFSNIKKYKKKFKITHTIIAKDCPRSEIWRVALYPAYKGTRGDTYKKTQFMGGKVFKYCYANMLPILLKEPSTRLMHLPTLEADDIIYLTTTEIVREHPDSTIHIISSDHDLLQIIDGRPNIKLWKANIKCYNDKSLGSADLDCFAKAMTGDTSDNIPKVCPRMGHKTMMKLYNSPELLHETFEKNSGSREQYTLNRTLIDFKYIPATLVQALAAKYPLYL
tara:strand:- start:28245 stop:29075 length:831 start_codon:yes stop_codon:yes gene_type:complete